MPALTASRRTPGGRRRRIRRGFRGLEFQLHRASDPAGPDAAMAGGDRRADPRAAARRVLEIGVGSGLLLSQLAPDCEEYWATDFSAPTIETLQDRRGRAARVGAAGAVAGAAGRRGRRVAGRAISTRSCSTRWCSTSRTRGICSTCSPRCCGCWPPGGAVFVGDVRNLALLREFDRRGGSWPGRMRRSPRRWCGSGCAGRCSAERELLLAPEFFAALPERFPRSAAVEVQLKRMRGGQRAQRLPLRGGVAQGAGGGAVAGGAPVRPWDRVRGAGRVGSICGAERPEAAAGQRDSACRAGRRGGRRRGRWTRPPTSAGSRSGRCPPARPPRRCRRRTCAAVGTEFGYTVAVTWSPTRAGWTPCSPCRHR